MLKNSLYAFTLLLSYALCAGDSHAITIKSTQSAQSPITPEIPFRPMIMEEEPSCLTAYSATCKDCYAHPYCKITREVTVCCAGLACASAVVGTCVAGCTPLMIKVISHSLAALP